MLHGVPNFPIINPVLTVKYTKHTPYCYTNLYRFMYTMVHLDVLFKDRSMSNIFWLLTDYLLLLFAVELLSDLGQIPLPTKGEVCT